MSRIALCLAVVSLVAVASVAHAQSRVGVTSASSGDPRGKPPTQAERVLHVGVDVQANELVRTGAGDRAHLLFLDGSSLTIGPQARLTIDRFVYDPNSKLGELAINASQGVLRFVGGKISKTSPVVVRTPSATLTVRGGIMIVNVEPTRTVATFVFGNAMVVQANGQTQTVTRPGWQVVTLAGQAPGVPVAAPAGALSGDMGQLEANQAQPGGSASKVDERLQSSGFADQNSGLGTSRGSGGLDQGVNNTATNAVNDAATQVQQQTQKPFVKPVQVDTPTKTFTRGQ